MRNNIIIFMLSALLTLLLPAQTAIAQSADEEVRYQIVQESVGAYLATGHPCACPYNSARNGSSCGGRSAYSKGGGAAPLCYFADVSDQMVEAWKSQHPAPS